MRHEEQRLRGFEERVYSPDAESEESMGYGRTDHHRTLGSLIVELTRELRDLVTAEFALARSEISGKLDQATAGLGSLVVGAAFALSGLLALVACAILAINLALQAWWLSSLIVGVSLLILGAIFAGVGKSKINARKLAPARSAENVHEDVQFLKEEFQRRI